MRWLVKIKFTATLWTIRPGSGPYVYCDTSDRTSDLEIVRPFQGFQRKPHFSLHVLLFSKSTPKTIKMLHKVS
jgi:hypothetical protein